MKGEIPFGSLTVSGPGSQTQALSTTAALLALFSASGGANGPANTRSGGNPDVYPDYANNRILVQAGQGAETVYRVTVVLSGTVDAAADLTLQIAKNGTAISDLINRMRWTNAVKNVQTLTGYFTVTPSDNPGTIPTFADPASTGFAGAGGAPKNEVPITILLGSLSGTPTITLEYAQFMIERVG